MMMVKSSAPAGHIRDAVDAVIDQLVPMLDHGDILIYGNEGNMPQEDVMRSIELFGTKVIPALKED